MNYILDDIERVVADVGNPQHCSLKQQKAELSNLNSSLNRDLRQKLLVISTSSVSPKIINHQIRIYQSSISVLLNNLQNAQCYCNHFYRCKEQLLNPLLNNLCDFLRFIYDHFPNAFDLELYAPQKVHDCFTSIINESTIPLLNQQTKNKPYKVLSDPFINFINHKKKKYTFYHIKYLHNLIEVIESIEPDSLSFEKMVEVCITHNINTSRVYNYITRGFKTSILEQKSPESKIKHYNLLLKWTEQIVVHLNKGYKLNKEPLKKSLIIWLKKERNFFNYNVHILKTPIEQKQEKIDVHAFPKIKTNLSVDQMGCFLRHMVDSGIIITGNKKETIKIIAEVFTSKNNDIVSNKSLKNKYFHNDRPSLESTKEVFLKLFKSIQR